MFAALLSAFLIFTITQLKPDSIDISEAILLHISLQLSNSSVPAFVEPEFLISSNVAAVNVLLFASLSLVLIGVYLAMLTKGWLRDFDGSWRSSNVPEERARAREMSFQGLERWKLPEMIAFLPLLIQAALVLFGVALLIILFNLHPPTAYSTLSITATTVLFHLRATMISAFDPNAPFSSPISRAMQTLIQRSRSHQVFPDVLLRFKWGPGRTTHKNMNGTKDAVVMWHKAEGAEIRLAMFNRLYAATSAAVENLPVFTELLDQWVHTPSLRPRSMSEWDQVLPLIQPSFSYTSPSKNPGPRSLARLFLCSNSKEFHKGRQAVIKALRKHDAGTEEPYPVDQLYIHLLHQPRPDWSLACQEVLKLETDSDTIVELRWILNWISYQLPLQSVEFPDEPDLSWISFMWNVTPFLCSTALFIIQKKMVNDDRGLFNSLLLVTRLIAYRSKKEDESHLITNLREPQTNSTGIDGSPFVSIGDFLVPPERQWKFIGDLYARYLIYISCWL